MTCRELADFLDDYLSGDLRPDVRSPFEHHLDVCANCRRYVDQYRQSIALGRAAFDDVNAQVPQNVPEDLVAAILAARSRR